MTMRKTLFSAVSAVALLAAGPVAAQELGSSQVPTDDGVENFTDAQGSQRSNNNLDADIIQEGTDSEAYIDQSDVNSNPDTRALIEQSGTGESSAYINQDEESVRAEIDQAGSEGADADIYQGEIGDSVGDDSLAEVDQRNADDADVDVIQTAESSEVQVDSFADDGDVNVRQFGDDNFTTVTQRDGTPSATENADVYQAPGSARNDARIVQ